MRRVFFWLHLIAGAFGGIVIFIMSVTGVLLTYEKQIAGWAGERHYAVTPVGSRLPVDQLLAKVRDHKHAMPDTLTLRNNVSSPAIFAYGRQTAVFANPYTGEILGEGPPAVRTFFAAVTDWHRWLGTDLANRPVARAITGACNFAFLFLVASGIYLWLPKRLTWQYLRPVVWFRRGLPGKARDFNWHNTIGFWCCVPLFFVVLGATVISYPWASNLAYRIAGSEPPAPASKGDAPRKGSEAKTGRKDDPGTSPAPGRPAPAAVPLKLDLAGLNTAWSRSEAQVPEWKTITLRLPARDRTPWSFTIDEGTAGQPQYRGTLTVDRSTGDVLRWEPFSSFDSGRRFRTWLRFVHTGEYYGIAGQTIAGIASLGGAVLVYSGFALAVRRFWAWRKRRQVELRQAVAA